MKNQLNQYLEEMPIIAILRGIRPEEVVDITEVLIGCGVRIIEIPLNSPKPFDGISTLQKVAGQRALCGAGTVTKVSQVEEVTKTGAKLIVTPNTDIDVIKGALSQELTIVPGCTTPTEAFAAIYAGASAVKLFPAGNLGIGYVKSLLAVLPSEIPKVVVGGVDENNLAEFKKLGIDGFGIGSSLYAAGDTADIVEQKAKRLVAKCM